jgi:hypothetical protein
LFLEAKGYNPGGIHAAYRTIRTFLNWWEQETEPEGWKNPIHKVRSTKGSGKTIRTCLNRPGGKTIINLHIKEFL